MSNTPNMDAAFKGFDEALKKALSGLDENLNNALGSLGVGLAEPTKTNVLPNLPGGSRGR